MKGACDAVKTVLEDGESDFGGLCAALPQFSKNDVSGALCSLYRNGWLSRNGTPRKRTYAKKVCSEPVRVVRSPKACPPHYKPSVFVGTLALKPHLLDPRANVGERESLAMLTR